MIRNTTKSERYKNIYLNLKYKMNPNVDTRPIFGDKSLRTMVDEEKAGGSTRLSRDEYLLKIQEFMQKRSWNISELNQKA